MTGVSEHNDSRHLNDAVCPTQKTGACHLVVAVASRWISERVDYMTKKEQRTPYCINEDQRLREISMLSFVVSERSVWLACYFHMYFQK